VFAVAGVKPVGIGLIQTTDISFPLNRKGSCKPLKTLWGSTMGVQSPSTEPSFCIARDTEGVGRVNIRSMPGKYSKLSEGTM